MKPNFIKEGEKTRIPFTDKKLVKIVFDNVLFIDDGRIKKLKTLH